MRLLGKYHKKKITITCTIDYFGFRANNVPTVCIKNIMKEGEELADHMWLDTPEQFVRMKILPKETVQFHALVWEYERLDGQRDYSFKYIHRVKRCA